ncbi:MAG: gliding motility-associated C-terminal domain-containing protein [Flavipsychrobacter sp.]|nr:gliding motility-associated C-terminal domain-containing protein [Flavipsychrobacter sp.]
MDTIIKSITILTPPNVTVNNISPICQGGTTPVSITASGASTYTWSPATGLSCTNCVNPTATISATTTYVVIGVDASGCADTNAVTITVNNKPNVGATSANAAICLGGSTALSATGASTYTWSPATGLSCTNCNNPTANPTTTTTYTVTGTDVNGCTDTGIVTVVVNNPPNVSAGTNAVICNGTSTTLTASGASTYLWSPATGLSCTTCTSPTANPATTTTYTVTGTDANGCIDTATVTVTVNALPSVSAGNNTSVCDGQPATLTASGATTYVWSPSATLSCSTCVSPIATPTTATVYTLVGTDANGCTNSATVTVGINTKPSVTATALNTAICTGSSTTLTGSGASTYTWSPATALTCTSCSTTTANPTATTTYTVTGTDANGCVDTGIVTITVNPLPNVSAGSNQTICAGNSATLTATGATTYLWTPSGTLSCSTCVSPVATPSTTTTYTVAGTDTNGCANTASVTVNVNQLPNVAAGNDVAICSGLSTTLTASGATSYVWTPSGTLSCSTCVSPVATPSTTTTYIVTGTDGNGCSKSDTVVVTVNNKPNVTISGNNTICEGSSTTLTGNGAISYVWSPTTALSCSTCTSPIANPAITTSYVVTGTDANGCVDTGMITVTVNTRPTVNAGIDRAICAGTSSSLSASGAVTYQWSPAVSLSCSACQSPTATPSATIVYSVIGVDNNGCSDTDQVLVTVNTLPTVSAGPSKSICAGSNTTLNASGAVNYIWSPVTSLSCTTCTTPVANPAATTTYVVTGTDANGCIDTGVATVTVNAIPVITISGTGTICEGSSTSLTALGAATYVWSPATALSCIGCNNPVANPASTTTYTVTGTTNGCTSNATITVNVIKKPLISITQDKAICEGVSVQLNVTGAQTYSWSPASGLSCTNCDAPVATPSATTTYIVTGTGADGCTATNQVTITVNPIPDVNAGDDVTICSGSTVKLNATGAVSYDWKPGNTLSCTNCADPTASPAVQTTYTVIGVDNIGCSDSDQVTVSIIDKSPISFGPDASFCKGGSAELYATGGSSYLWIPADGLSNHQTGTTTATPDKTITYKVIVKQGNCFTDTGYITVNVHPLPFVDLGPDVTIGGGNSVQLNASGEGIRNYKWSPEIDLSCVDCATPKAAPRKTTNYNVVVTNEKGCSAEDNITVRVTCDNNQIFLPNTFTPNNDGVNDKFFPQGKGITHVKSFRVYSRWGELIFARDDMKINDPSIGWDGTYKQTPLKPDVFVYMVNAFCESGEPIEIKGDISLVR